MVAITLRSEAKIVLGSEPSGNSKKRMLAPGCIGYEPGEYEPVAAHGLRGIRVDA
jgi:hypothetical protein